MNFLKFARSVAPSNDVVRNEFQLRQLYTGAQKLQSAFVVVFLVLECDQERKDWFEVFRLDASLQQLQNDLAVPRTTSALF